MKYNFDEKIDRYNTGSIKYMPELFGKEAGLLPMWVADMDFKAPPCVFEALRKCAEHGVFGYSVPVSDYNEILRRWFAERHGWTVNTDNAIQTFGVVNALYLAVRALSSEGDGVIIQEPVYYPFAEVVRNMGRTLLDNELVLKNGRYEMDLEDFERKAKDAKLFILCSPHNPVGRVWTREELNAVGEICLRHGVTVISDEIHQDFVFAPNRHTVFESISPELADITVTCTAPSKTFNLAGLTLSNVFISNEKIRRKFRREYSLMGLSQTSLTGLAACRAAYANGGEWLDELLVYLKGNLDFTREFLRGQLPEIKLVEPEGTYLLWLDCRELNIPDLDDFMLNKAKLWLDGGEMFGASGKGFQRVNMACPRATLKEALTRLKNAVRGL